MLENGATWQQIMATATSDAIRQIMMNEASSVIVGSKLVADDNRTKVSSRAQAVHTHCILQHLERKHQGKQRYGPTKGAVQIDGGSDQRSIENCPFVDTYVSLGVARGGCLLLEPTCSE
jgi:hypothetical protein